MTAPAIKVLWLATLAVSASAVGLSASAAYRARANAESEVDSARDLASKAGQIDGLRRSLPSWGSTYRPDGPLAPSLSAALTASGLPPGALSSVSADVPLPASGESDLKMIQRQRAAVALTRLTLPQLGTFLAAWRNREPAWVITAIELAPDGAGDGGGAASGGDLPLRATMTMEMLFVDRIQGGRP